MSTSIAFLSGKGGSGKTTLALSIADLLFKSGINTLLIDCDLITNGASFFYEEQLPRRNPNKKVRPVSLSDWFHYDGEPGLPPIPMTIQSDAEATLDFFPSISYMAGKESISEWKSITNSHISDKMNLLFDWAMSSYDVVLFDCSAGYTDLLPDIIPLVNINLFVLEPDSVSASAMRNLYLKAGSSFGNSKPLQVFNKASKDEYEIYNKIDGTFFTNMGILLFDWKIRLAFSRSQVPDLEHISSEYGKSLCILCQDMIKEKSVSSKIERFVKKLERHKLEEEERQISAQINASKSKLEELETDRPSPGKQILEYIPILLVNGIGASLIALVYWAGIYLIKSDNFVWEYKWTGFVIGIAFFTLIVSVSCILILKSLRRERKKYSKEKAEIVQTNDTHQRVLNAIKEQIEVLDRQINAG